MSTTTPVFTGPSTGKKPSGPVNRTYSFLSSIPTGVLWILVVIWSVPTVGLFLPAGAFVQAFIPLIVFFSLQRYFVRGILAGSVKG